MKKAVVLAAGEGTRMKSSTPKVLHKILGTPMLEHVVKTLKEIEIDEIIVIIGHKKELIKESFKNFDLTFREQPMGENLPYGTAFAVKQALDRIEKDDDVLILCGDTPLFKTETLEKFLESNKNSNVKASVMTAVLEKNFGYGRIIKDEDGFVKEIVEEKDADSKQKEIKEINSGVYLFKGEILLNNLEAVENNNSKREYYLTDLIKILNSKNEKIAGFPLEDSTEMLGVNSRVQLFEAQKILQKRIISYWMEEGVSFLNSESTLIGRDVKIGGDTIIYPNVRIFGNSEIGERNILEGDTKIVDSKIGNDCEIKSAYIEETEIGNFVTIGPFAHFRPKTVIKDKAHIGNFVELKKSVFGENSKAGHLAYIGDSDVGKNVNIGCGAITVNYDGKNKNRTTIEDGAFIGSNSNLVAPVEVEKNAYVACGSTITKKVEDGELAIERSTQKNIKGWVKKKGLYKN